MSKLTRTLLLATIATLFAIDASADKNGFFLMASGGVAIPTGDISNVAYTGGGLTAGIGYDFSEYLALEGEFVGQWAPVSRYYGGGTGGAYSGILGARATLPISGDEKFGIYAAAGIGVVHYAAGTYWSTQFGWQVKTGIQYQALESTQIFLDGRYTAQSNQSGSGIFGINIGLRFFPLI